MWLEIERELHPVDMAIWFGCFLAGVVFACYGEWVRGLFTWIGGGCLCFLATNFLLSCLLPRGARAAARRARAEFERLYPRDTVTSIAVRAAEPERFVISVRYDGEIMRAVPTLRRYFAVSRTEDGIVTELDERDWWPRGLK